jgi:ubiquinone/menaquinone biosynthesis C-methylase UbiE
MSRTPERLRHHYEVEKELASRLRASTREERPALFQKLYQELFNRVPDHPRLTRQESETGNARRVQNQLNLLRNFLQPGHTLVEFAPGDGRLATAAAQWVGSTGRVIGVDISDQRAAGQAVPANFELVVYDGYHLDLPDSVADVVFSYQFLEHLHPEDINLHFELANRLLKPGGWYVLSTPHRYSGPHDIARHFGSELVCFHFQEWTYGSMERTVRAAGFSELVAVKEGKPLHGPLGWAWRSAEAVAGLMPKSLQGALADQYFLNVTAAARKPLLQ